MTDAEQQSAPPRTPVNQHFHDMGTLGEAIAWDIDFRQLDAGKLNARVVLMAGRRNSAMRVEFDRKFHQRGAPPPGILVFGFPDNESGPLRWNGSETAPGALLNFNHGRLDGVNRGYFGGYTLAFTEELLNEVASIHNIELDISSCLDSIAFWNPGDGEHEYLRQVLRQLERVAVGKAESGRRELAEAFNFDIAASVVRILGRDHSRAPRASAPFRYAALKRALRLIDEPGQPSPPSVAQMCKIVGASWATLDRAFAEEFGVSPKAYIRSRRLGAVRRELLKSEPGALIADIASHSDFWHMGRFAADYRRQFGELPSETLRSHDRS